MTDILSILQWLVPAGGLGSLFVWLVNRTLRNTRTAKEVHDTYKAMYEDVRGTLIEFQNRYENLYKAFVRLEHVISRAGTCRHWTSCPMRPWLRYQREDYHDRENRKPPGQPTIRGPGHDNGRDTGRAGDAGLDDGEPP